MTEATRTRAPRRSAEQLAAEAQAKANSYRAKADKAKRAAETRQKVITGSGLMGLAASGDVEAMRVLERVKANLTRPQDRAAFGLAETVASPPAPVEVKLRADDLAIRRAAIEAAVHAHAAIPESDRAARNEGAAAWRKAVVAWERLSGVSFVKEEKRAQLKLGAIGELA